LEYNYVHCFRIDSNLDISLSGKTTTTELQEVDIQPKTKSVKPAQQNSNVTAPPNKRRKVNEKTSKKKGSTKGNNQKSLEPKIPGPILANDPRRTYPRMFLNTFNSCDIRKLTEVFNKYCTEDVVAYHKYEGIQNPYGRNSSRLKGREVIINLWQNLFKSAPDFYFQPSETRAFYDPQYRVVVACQYNWSGTRVLDIKYAEIENENVLKTKLANAEAFSTDEKTIFEIMSKEKMKNQTQTSESIFVTPPLATSSSSIALDTTVVVSSSSSSNTASEGGTKVVKDEYFFAGDELVIEETDSKVQKFYLEEIPTALAHKREMRCKGTFILYLNEQNLVYRYESVYISMDEVESQARVAAITSTSNALPSSTTTTTTSTTTTTTTAPTTTTGKRSIDEISQPST
jgi:hypothetical protein